MRSTEVEGVKEKGRRMTHYEFVDVEQVLREKHGEKWDKYRKDWHYHTNTLIAAPIPLYIVLETNSYCNMRCKMCHHSLDNYPSGPKENISPEILNKLVDECTQLGVPSIAVGGMTECTINPDIKKILKKVTETGAMDKFLFTNGSMLSEDFCEFILDIGFERVFVSLDAARPETYREIRGYDLEKIENNLLRLIKKRKERNASVPIIRVSFVCQKDNMDEIDMFLEKWKSTVDVIDFQELLDLSNLMDPKELPNSSFPCSAPFTSMLVDCRGDIYACCSLYSRYFKLGNLKEMTLMEAWNCEKIRSLRDSIRNGTLPVACRNCVEKVY